MLLLMMGVCLCACGRNGQTAEGEPASGILQLGCFYEDNIIVLSAPERFLYSEWEPIGFEYICTDPTCSHTSDSCSARTYQDDSVQEQNLGVVYHDRLIIVHSYQEHVDHGSHVIDGVTKVDVSYVWHTDVYEADLDGENRKRKLSFDGGIANVSLAFAAVLEEGVLYFGGPIESRIVMEYDEEGVVSRNEVIQSDAFYAVDLEDYSVRLFAEADGKDSMSYSYYVGVFDGLIYARTSDAWFGRGAWYRFDEETGECEEIMYFDSDAPYFFGVIEDNVYYYYQGKPVLYAMDMETKEERKVLEAGTDQFFLEAAVFEDQIWVLTDYSMEEGNYMSEYTVLNAAGEVIDFCHYDDYILFYGVVGDRLIYCTAFPEGKMWWADRSDIKNLTERGTYIGYEDARYHDVLSYGTESENP